MRQKKPTLVVEPIGGGKAEFQSACNLYKQGIGISVGTLQGSGDDTESCAASGDTDVHNAVNGAAMFAVYRGKMSEGMSFNDDMAVLPPLLAFLRTVAIQCLVFIIHILLPCFLRGRC
jgi:hypothetical protein